ncbi:biliverdin-producing heme oxygenase [Aquimarina sp. ERC-38]|uniref:biliverdin-producing heme oxygenase n=1 Tax=Aquimarina sp. ERC-38 TaxID=2949996 RepID=UPI00224604A3|nr:biliverdin-producing heme oxygenase [Aquimarina sp. ERC-38]UZO81119.1 biliverdin-producing heme oxygenase [Aquimarina sp. ERC-38]
MLDDLKRATAAAHEKAEEHNPARHIIDHSITENQYHKLLAHNYQVYYAVEKFADNHKSKLPEKVQNLLSFNKTDRLKNDLESLGQSVAEIPDIDLTIPATRASIIGALYVIEGSMMGGMLIARHLKQCDQLSQKESKFYGGKPQQHVQRWQQFKDSVVDENFTDQEVQEAIKSANIIFKLF